VRLAIVYDAAFPWVKGGGEKRIADLAEHLSAAGMDVHLYCMKFWTGPRRLERRGVTLHGICPAMPLYNRRGRRSIRQALFFGIACFSLAREPFDKIDCCGFPFFSLVVCAAIAKLRRKRIVSTWLEVWGRAYWTEYLGGLGVLGALVERVCAQLPDRFVSISELTTSRLVEILHVPRKRIATIPIGVDLGSIDREPFDPIRSDVLYVGRLMAFKNVDVVIRAIARLRDEGLTLRFRIIGDGPEMPRLRSLTAALGVAETVRFEGFIADHPYACMKSTRMLVVPSQREGFGIVAVEAMACGVPVVTVDEPENATRFLVSPDTGIVTEATVGALATAFRSIAESDRDWQLSCRAHAERYEWSRIARDVATEYAADS
jgi:glycosyltransferase involved in cell wall biosynthesis